MVSRLLHCIVFLSVANCGGWGGRKKTAAPPVAVVEKSSSRTPQITLKKTVENEVNRKAKQEKEKALADPYTEQYRQYKTLWKQMSPKIFYGEEMELEVRYFKVKAGHITIKTMPNQSIKGRQAYHIRGDIRSAPFYRYIYELRDSIETFIDTETFLPLKYSLIQRESGKNVDDLQVFDHQKLQTHFSYKRVKKGKVKQSNKVVPIPAYFQDSFSALQFARGLPLAVGKKYEFPVVTRGKVWIVKMQAIKREKIKVLGRNQEAIVVKAQTQFPGALEKKGDILFWFSADSTRKILRFDAKVKLGKIYAKLVRYRAGQVRAR